MRCYSCMQEKPNNEQTCPNCGYINNSNDGEHYYLPEGTLLNERYLLGRVLGHGGFGITYIGFDTNLHITVAIKEYLPTDVATRALGEMEVTIFSGEKKNQFEYGQTRFLDEARTLASYHQHPGIVDTRDFVRANNTSYLVMEFLDGIPLSEYMKRKGGSLLFQEALSIMMPVMDALREVHKSGMIHRDISPDNIYITKTGQVKLLDFGAARFAMGEKSKSLSVILKPGYAPPEQYTSRGKQGAWTDVYATAATLYRMVEGKNLDEAMDRMMDDHIEFTEATPTEYRDMFERALKVKVDERLQSMESLQMMLSSNKSQVEPVNYVAESLDETVDMEQSDYRETDERLFEQPKELIQMNLDVYNDIYNRKRLNIINMGINDISNLTKLKQIEYLNLSHNQIYDITSLVELVNLKELNLYANHIRSIEGLENLAHLEKLNILGNPLVFTPENKKVIYELTLRKCQVRCKKEFKEALK